MAPARRFRAVQTRVFGFFAPKTHKKQKTSSKNARTTHTIDRNFIEYSTTIHLKGLEKFTILQNEPWICCGKISIVNLTEGNMFLMLKWSPGTYFLKIRFTIDYRYLHIQGSFCNIIGVVKLLIIETFALFMVAIVYDASDFSLICLLNLFLKSLVRQC